MTELTICIPVYNGAEFISGAMDSIRRQTLQDFTVLIYDDGSTDGTDGIVRSFHDDRVRLVVGGENRGALYVRSQMIPMVNTEYCMWLDDDDYFCRDDALEHALSIAKSESFDMVNFTRMNLVGEDGTITVQPPWKYGDFTYFGDRFFETYFPTENSETFTSKIIKSEILKKSLPDAAVLSRRFASDDIFVVPMAFFHVKRYCNVATEPAIYAYRSNIGYWGSKKNDLSPERFRDLCELYSNVMLSLYGRMMAVRELSPVEKSSLVNGIPFVEMCEKVRGVRETLGDEKADELKGIWHEYFCRDGIHLMNDCPDFEMPPYVAHLEKCVG